jgi:hypothetical protein
MNGVRGGADLELMQGYELSRLEKHHDLDAILSHVEKRRVNADYTFPLGAKIYRILRQDVSAGLRGAYIRVEQRRMVRLPLALADVISGWRDASRDPR